MMPAARGKEKRWPRTMELFVTVIVDIYACIPSSRFIVRGVDVARASHKYGEDLVAV